MLPLMVESAKYIGIGEHFSSLTSLKVNFCPFVETLCSTLFDNILDIMSQSITNGLLLLSLSTLNISAS